MGCYGSLLPIFSKLFEKLILDSMYEFIDENLFNKIQSGIRPDDSCILNLLPSQTTSLIFMMLMMLILYTDL